MITQHDAVYKAVLHAASAMCAAAITAPKACGRDSVLAAVLTGDEIGCLAARMDELEAGRNKHIPIFSRDASLLRACEAVVLLGTKRTCRALNCGLCGDQSCAAAVAGGHHCAFDDIDLGIALGSAVSVAADLRMDNRILYTAGTAAMDLHLLGPEVSTIMAIPLSVSCRNQFFIRDNNC